MTEKTDQTATDQPPTLAGATYQQLLDHLRACQDVTALFKLSTSDEFKQAARALPEKELKQLRADYKSCQIALDGKVRLETFDGQILNIVNVDWWHSDTYDNDGVTLHIQPESEPGKKYKCLTSSAVIVRFCGKLNPLPTPEKPTRVLVHLEPVKDAARAAKGQRVWQIKQLPAASGMPDDMLF